MSLDLLLFFIFSSLGLFSAICVLSAKNPIHSVLFLILVFISAAGLFLLLGVEFLALIFLVVYVGAIAVLFLFVVMMLNIKITEINERIQGYLPVGSFISILVFFEIVLLLQQDLSFAYIDNDYKIILESSAYMNWLEAWLPQVETQLLARLLYNYYFYAYLLSGLILLVAMIGCIMLTLTSSYEQQRQQIFVQLRRSNQLVFADIKKRF